MSLNCLHIVHFFFVLLLSLLMELPGLLYPSRLPEPPTPLLSPLPPSPVRFCLLLLLVSSSLSPLSSVDGLPSSATNPSSPDFGRCDDDGAAADDDVDADASTAGVLLSIVVLLLLLFCILQCNGQKSGPCWYLSWQQRQQQQGDSSRRPACLWPFWISPDLYAALRVRRMTYRPRKNSHTSYYYYYYSTKAKYSTACSYCNSVLHLTCLHVSCAAFGSALSTKQLQQLHRIVFAECSTLSSQECPTVSLFCFVVFNAVVP